MGMLAGFASDGLAGAERGALAGMAEMMDGHLFDEEDAFRLEQLLPNETTAVVALIEHLWAAPLLAAVSRANGFELFNEWLEPTQIMEAGGKFRIASPPRTTRDDHPIWVMASRTHSEDTCTVGSGERRRTKGATWARRKVLAGDSSAGRSRALFAGLLLFLLIGNAWARWGFLGMFLVLSAILSPSAGSSTGSEARTLRLAG